MKLDFTPEEAIIQEAIIDARKVQEYLWGGDSLMFHPYEPDIWRSVFQKRINKISEVDLNTPSGLIELRKRLLQQAALSILALRKADELLQSQQ